MASSDESKDLRRRLFEMLDEMEPYDAMEAVKDLYRRLFHTRHDELQRANARIADQEALIQKLIDVVAMSHGYLESSYRIALSRDELTVEENKRDLNRLNEVFEEAIASGYKITIHE